MRNLQFTVTTLNCLLQAHQREQEQLRGIVTGAVTRHSNGSRSSKRKKVPVRRNRKESKKGVGTGKRRRNKEQEQGKEQVAGAVTKVKEQLQVTGATARNCNRKKKKNCNQKKEEKLER